MELANTTEPVIRLTENIQLPISIKEKIAFALTKLPDRLLKHYGHQLIDKKTAQQTAHYLSETYQDDSFSELAFHLYAATLSWKEIYQPLTIPTTIYLATMKAFTRFTKERLAVGAEAQFDRGRWTWRYLCGAAYRIDELEFEMQLPPYSNKQPELDGKPALSIHIPSDAQLDSKMLKQTYREAIAFFARYFPDYHYTAMYTDTWLLSPQLAQWLNPTAKIVRFAKDYQLLQIEPEKDDGIAWIFHRLDRQIDTYPQHTSLQRAAKKSLLQGEHIGSALGILQIDNFK
ncbi:acyltransferase domain-containing protein [Enterococcus faecalis]